MCKLCSTLSNELIIKNKYYYLCPNCNLLEKKEQYFLSEEDELKRYNFHKNCNLTQYIQYMGNCAKEFKEYLYGKILDFGCGFAKSLHLVYPTYDIISYDYFYHKIIYDNVTYDTICIIEVLEHLKDPKLELQKLLNLLNKNGKLIIKTNFYEIDSLSGWWYLNDSTHYTFYNMNVFLYIEKKYQLKIIYSNYKDLIVFEK